MSDRSASVAEFLIECPSAQSSTYEQLVSRVTAIWPDLTQDEWERGWSIAYEVKAMDAAFAHGDAIVGDGTTPQVTALPRGRHWTVSVTLPCDQVSIGTFTTRDTALKAAGRFAGLVGGVVHK